jgi:NADH:ubiquinone reductase (H+-translocating)
LAAISRHTLPQEFRPCNPRDAQIHLLGAVTQIDHDGVTLGDIRIQNKTVLCRIVARAIFRRELGSRRQSQGASRSFLASTSRGFVVGDLASVIQANAQPVPGSAPAAKQMGAYVAAVIHARLHQKNSRAFRYRDYGNLATIGRKAAVVDLRKLKFSGFLAWCFWLSAHLFFLIGFRNRLVVLMDWAWSYFTYQRNARIIGKAQARK